MTDSDDGMIQGLVRGDPEAARVFMQKYGPMLERLADQHLAGGMRRRVGPETICQSACRSFLRRAQAGEYQLADNEGLWGLVCAITLTKVREQVRFHRRQKRSVDREQMMDAPVGSEDEGRRFESADDGLAPDEIVEFKEQFESLVSQFDEEERQLLELKLQMMTNDEAAVKMGCSERTVRRILQRIKSHLQRHFESGDSST